MQWHSPRMRSIAISWTLSLSISLASTENAPPAPLVIPASQYFEGNEGPWSTFDIRVGNPEQDIRVLVSTASPFSLVPFDSDACSTSVFKTVPPDCAVSRGNLFNHNKSSTWHDIGLYGINQNGVGLEANLGYQARVQFGLDGLALGLTGPKLDNQTVGGIAAPEPFYLCDPHEGILGTNPQPLNFSSLGNFSTQPLLTTLKDEGKIPSLSWSYTAGAKYRLKQVYGQLIFGGYDTSRFDENHVSFSMADDITRDLVVALQSISYSGSSSATLLSNPINIMIDSTDPYLWLPEDVCTAFEQAFGLTLDDASGLYLVNETHRDALLNSNAQVSFRISDVKSGGDTVTIVLPYAAFDLTAGNPLVSGNASHYFPLKRANSSTQYTLGRTFLQEAYLSVDYERKVFNVSACTWNQGAQENIVAILPGNSDPSGSGGGSNNGNGSPDSGHGLSGGAIAGIVIGSILGALLLAAILTIIILRLRRKWLGKGFAVAAKDPAPDESVLKGPVFNSPSARHDSTPDGSLAPYYSAADVSAAGSGSRQGSDAAAVVAAGAVGASSSSSGTPPVDSAGRPGTAELDGNEINNIHEPLSAVAENPEGVFELPGSAPPPVVTDGRGRTMETDRGPSPLGSVRSSRGEVGDGGKRAMARTPSPPTATSEVNPAAFGRHSLVSNS